MRNISDKQANRLTAAMATVLKELADARIIVTLVEQRCGRGFEDDLDDQIRRKVFELLGEWLRGDEHDNTLLTDPPEGLRRFSKFVDTIACAVIAAHLMRAQVQEGNA